jgi:hypothetical protein
MDLADVGGNVKDGCHIASMGGTWMMGKSTVAKELAARLGWPFDWTDRRRPPALARSSGRLDQ